MPDTSSSESFVFITSTSRLRPDNNHARQLIRRQAMSRAAYSRRQRGGYGKVNLLQAPGQAQPMSSDQSHNPPEQCAIQYIDNKTLDCHLSAAIPISPSSVDYERMRIRYNVDLLDLSALTSFHVTYATASSLALKPDILRDIVRQQQLSYLTHVPSRYGQSHALASAVECVSARAHQWLTAPHQPPSSDIIVLYLRALKAVQAALEDSRTNMQPEVLCATELLGIYELFNTSTEQRWASHSSGSTALIKLRGPDRYTGDFEKALLVSHVGQIFHHSLNTNESCFLQDGPWQLVFRSIATNDGPFSDTSERVISLWESACRIPYHLQKTVKIMREGGGSIADPFIKELHTSLHQVRRSLWHWHRQYQEYSQGLGLCGLLHRSVDKDQQYETLGFAFACLVIINRLIFALDPAGERNCEEEAQRLSIEILDIGAMKISTVSRSELFLYVKTHVAHKTRATEASWRNWATGTHASSCSTPPLLPRHIWIEWCHLVGWQYV